MALKKPIKEYNLYYDISDTPTFQATALSVILLAIGFAIRLIKLMPFPSRVFNIITRQQPIRWLRRSITDLSWSASSSRNFENHRDLCKSVFGLQPLFAALVVGHIYFDLVSSMLGEVSLLPLIINTPTHLLT